MITLSVRLVMVFIPYSEVVSVVNRFFIDESDFSLPSISLLGYYVMVGINIKGG